MANVGRLSNTGEMFAFEFDDNTNNSFSVSNTSTVFSNKFEENSSGGLMSFNFRYHAYGVNTNETTVYWYNETTSTLNTLTTISGQQHTSNADEWDLYELDLSSYAGETGRIVVRYSTGSDFNQDPALDEMELVGTTTGTINLDPSNTQPNGGWEQQGGNSSTYPTTGYGALTTNAEDPTDYWQYDINGTPSNDSGPDQDYNNNGTSTPSGYYIYFEGSSPNNTTGIYGWLRTSSTYTLSTPSVKMRATSSGNLIILDSINEVDSFDNIPTSNLELHLDASSGFISQQEYYTTAGTYTFTVPAGVTQLSAVVVGGGGGGAGSDGTESQGNTGGGGGGLAYGTFTVTPGENLTVTVGAAGQAGSNTGTDGTAGGDTTIARGATTLLSGGGGLGGQNESTASRAGGSSGGTERDGGGNGGSSGSATDSNSGSGGGGAGGYSGNGGNGGSNGGTGAAGSGGGGGGGDSFTTGQADRGGGVGLFGEGISGAASGGGGSGSTSYFYGGGGGARDDDSAGFGSSGGPGAVRIVWGSGRSYPSTNLGDNFSWKDISGNNRQATIPVDTNVSLLLNGNGSNGSTTITDSSAYNRIITVNGNAQISTAQKKFGASSMFFDGNGDYIRAANSSEFAFGTGDFTVEAWLRGTGDFFETRTALSSAGFGYAVTSNTIKVWDGQGGSYIYNGSTTYDWTDWHHVAISREGTTLRVFVDGSLDGTATTSRNLTEQGGIVGANINQVVNTTNASVFNGYIDDLRITKGVARYTSAFTPFGSQLSVYWDPYAIGGGGGQSGNDSFSILRLKSTIKVGQSTVIPEIRAITGLGNFTYDLYNPSDSADLSLNSNGEVRLMPTFVIQSPVVGPIQPTLGTREFFKFGGSNYQGIQNTTLRIPPQQVEYNAIRLSHINDGTPINPAGSSSINNQAIAAISVPFEKISRRLGVCNGNGGGSAYTGVTGTAARTVILGVKFPASPASSYTAFSYGANAAGQRFNIRLQSTGQIRILFGSSYVEIPTTAIDDLNDFQLIAITVPASGTVSDVRVWLNGNEVTSQLTVSGGTTAINTSSANNVTIGGSSHGTVEYLDDSVITKVMIYSVVLSDLEIKQIYQSIIPDIYPFVERAS